LKSGDVNACRALLQSCNLRARETTVLWGDLHCWEGQFEQAVTKYGEALETDNGEMESRKDYYYRVLDKLIVALWRLGRIEDAKEWFVVIEKKDCCAAAVISHPGYAFCKGLYHKYSNNPKSAIEHFNMARPHKEFQREALEHMIDIYMHRDKIKMWSNGEEYVKSRNVSIAEALLKELVMCCSGGVMKMTTTVWENYVMMANKTTADIDRAVQSFITILETDKDNPPALLGLATAFHLENGHHNASSKRNNKARNTLKKLAKIPYNPLYAQEFESAYLHLARSYYIAGRQKYDLATELCQRVLVYNKSCVMAWDILGDIMTREESFHDAVTCRNTCWKLVCQSNSNNGTAGELKEEEEDVVTMGYKLANCYYAAGRFVESVAVCDESVERALLRGYKEGEEGGGVISRMEKDVLKKCVLALRP